VFQFSIVSSDLADGVYKIAVPLLALQLTRSAIAVTVVGLAVRLPWLVTTLPAGVVVDRYDPRLVMRWASAFRLVLVLVMCGLIAAGRLPLWGLTAAAFLIGSAGILVDVASQSQLPRLVGAAQLPRANASLQSTQMFLAQLLGPALGGFVAGLGLGGGLTTAAVLYVVAMWTLGKLPAPAEPVEVASSSSLRALIGELSEGVAYFRTRRDLVRLATTAATNNLSYAMCFTILPLWAVAPGPLRLSPDGYGLLLACLAVGPITVGPFATRVVAAVGEHRLLNFGAPALGLCFALIAVPVAPAVGAGFLCYGAVALLWTVVVTSYRQSTVPRSIFGRVNAAFRWLTWGVIPLGALAGGVLAAVFDARTVFLVAGALPFAAGVLSRVLAGKVLISAER
jgi:MFS family permease